MSLELSTLADIKLSANTTVNLNSTMTTAEIQALIDAQPKNLNGKTLLFQFADGTYTITATLTFKNFYNGALSIFGNTSDNTWSTTKSVYLNGSGFNGAVIYASNCNINYGQINYLKIQVGDYAGQQGILVSQCKYMNVYACYIYGPSKVNNPQAIHYNNGSYGYVGTNYVSNVGYGMVGYYNSDISSENNASTGTLPNYGMQSSFGTVVGKSGAQFTASISAEVANAGGVIR